MKIEFAMETIAELLRLFLQIQARTGNPVFLSISEKNNEIMCDNIREKLITTCSGKKKCTNNPK